MLDERARTLLTETHKESPTDRSSVEVGKSSKRSVSFRANRLGFYL